MSSSSVLPYRLEQRSSRASALILLALLVPAVAALVVPVGLAIGRADDVLAIAQQNPMASVQLVVGFLLWTALFIVPVWGLIERFGSSRTVVVGRAKVSVRETTLFGTRSLDAGLSDFDGIAHVVRTSLSGIRHELVLVDRVRNRRIVFRVADRIGAETIADISQQLGLPQIEAREALSLGALGTDVSAQAALNIAGPKTA